MTTLQCKEAPHGGFSFENCARNDFLEECQVKVPGATKTGTTIVGVIFKDGVLLGADTRATNGSTVADKNCEKIHYIAPNIYCCGAGTAADTENVTGLISSQLELHRLSTGRDSRVKTACTLLKQHLFKYQGNIGAALVLGGIDVNGPSLYSIHPHGSVDKLQYVTMGSGSLAAMAVFEAGFKSDMDLEQAKNLVKDAICAGIFHDLGSGSNVDMTVITKDGIDYLRNIHMPVQKNERAAKSYKYARGTTPVLKTEVRNFVVVDEEVTMAID